MIAATPPPMPPCVEVQQVQWMAMTFGGAEADLLAALAEMRREHPDVEVGVDGSATKPKALLISSRGDAPFRDIGGVVSIAQRHHLKARGYYSYPALCRTPAMGR
jgi:hypothetical protein